VIVICGLCANMSDVALIETKNTASSLGRATWSHAYAPIETWVSIQCFRFVCEHMGEHPRLQIFPSRDGLTSGTSNQKQLWVESPVLHRIRVPTVLSQSPGTYYRDASLGHFLVATIIGRSICMVEDFVDDTIFYSLVRRHVQGAVDVLLQLLDLLLCGL